MPLINDEEYQKELNHIVETANADARGLWWSGIITVSAILTVTLFILENINVSETLKISIILSVACVCIVGIISSAVGTMFGALRLLIGTVEWCGRKQLGEYEAPVK